ncbi:hypothetical protein M9H77_23658 [Catharanthus roseus]|uniref:Uncharacterized protein n=1 Tax=Catharanthus roseus TaxID=4058 RepID=A0ACC0AVG3_CATRO|nr:hypothetical protein M9H77_23658 [Catharanthus roseus]
MNRSNSSHVPLLPRLSLLQSMKDDGFYNLSLMKEPKGSVRPNPLKMIKALEGVLFIYDNLTSVKKALNRSEKLCISPERGLQKAIHTDSLKIQPHIFECAGFGPLHYDTTCTDLESNPPEDLDIRRNGLKLLKWIIRASLLLVTSAAAKTSFN